jgi:hypothetical protein
VDPNACGPPSAISGIAKVETDNDNRTKIIFERRWAPAAAEPGEKKSGSHAPSGTALFGTAPAWNTLPVALRIGEIDLRQPAWSLSGALADMELEWADQTFPTSKDGSLDAVFSIAVNSWIVRSASHTELYRVQSVAEESIAQFNITGKATRLSLEGENLDRFSPRNASVFAQSEELALAETPINEPIEGKEIELEGRFDELPQNRTLLLKGKRIRLQIQPEAESLSLISESDPFLSVSLVPGDELIVLQPAVPVEGSTTGEKTWRLEDEAAFKGLLTVQDDLIELVAASEDDDDQVETVVAQVLPRTKPIPNSPSRPASETSP